MRLRNSLLTLLVCLLPIGIATPVSAHFLSSNNGVQSVLHTDPDDAPVAHHKSQLVFYLSSAGGGFSALHCGCTLVVSSQGKVIARPPLQLSATTARAEMTFPAAGAYGITLRGNDFHIAYTLRVTAPGDSFLNPGTQVLALSGLSLVVLVVVAWRAIRDGGRYSKK